MWAKGVQCVVGGGQSQRLWQSDFRVQKLGGVRGRSSKESRCSFSLREACGSGITFKPPGCLPGEVFRAHPTGRRPPEDPGHAEGTMSLSWLWSTLGSPWRGKFELPCSGSCLCIPNWDKLKKMDGWVDANSCGQELSFLSFLQYCK